MFFFWKSIKIAKSSYVKWVLNDDFTAKLLKLQNYCAGSVGRILL